MGSSYAVTQDVENIIPPVRVSSLVIAKNMMI